jgi:hypothetical protein
MEGYDDIINKLNNKLTTYENENNEESKIIESQIKFYLGCKKKLEYNFNFDDFEYSVMNNVVYFYIEKNCNTEYERSIVNYSVSCFIKYSDHINKLSDYGKFALNFSADFAPNINLSNKIFIGSIDERNKIKAHIKMVKKDGRVQMLYWNDRYGVQISFSGYLQNDTLKVSSLL